jgi:YD repeat-containing protein
VNLTFCKKVLIAVAFPLSFIPGISIADTTITLDSVSNTQSNPVTIGPLSAGTYYVSYLGGAWNPWCAWDPNKGWINAYSVQSSGSSTATQYSSGGVAPTSSASALSGGASPNPQTLPSSLLLNFFIQDSVYTDNCGTITLMLSVSNPAKNAGPTCSKSGAQQTAHTNPCNAGTGNKYQPETDYLGSGLYPLHGERIYNSGVLSPAVIGITAWGSQWRGFYDRSVGNKINGIAGTATVKRADGKQYYFTLTNGVWIGDADVNGTLNEIGVDASGNPTGWIYKNENDETETYNAIGQLISITNRAGLTQTLTYSDGTVGVNGGYVLDATGNPTTTVLPSGKLIRVTDPANRMLQYGYDAVGRTVKMTDPSGGIYVFTYSDVTTSTANLASVTYPDSKVRMYLYGEAANVSSTPAAGVSYAHSLTGIKDENGTRFASWTYDSQNRATSSEHGAFGSGIDHVGLAYGNADANGNSVTTVTDPKGNVRSYSFITLLGVIKNTGITGQPCNGCSAAFTYDANGNVASQTDFNGNITTYQYDLTRNLETSRVEASGTPQARTITTSWHPTYRLPVAIAEPLRLTTFTYDQSGNLLSKTIQATTDANGSQGFNAPVTGAPRTWSYTYNQYGQVLTATGPRTDVVDVTSYTYDPATGNLLTITNAAGQVTTLSNYDLNGRVGTIADPNGIVTNLSYAPRGWLLSKSVRSADGSSTQTTSYQYDGVGQLTVVTLPDNSTINYTYDDAHRLTNIADSLGNSIAYTLDAMGNRVNEQTKDPTGTLSRQITRIYDALNRLQQVTGAVQ